MFKHGTWYDIETAPTDENEEGGRDDYPYMYGPEIILKGKYMVVADSWRGSNNGWQVTHWMPLPEVSIGKDVKP